VEIAEMSPRKLSRNQCIWLSFAFVFGLSLAVGAVVGVTRPAIAAPQASPSIQEPGYAGSQSCATCHEEIVNVWQSTRHANAFSSPIFQRDWSEIGSDVACLECHTTGWDPASGGYVEEGVTCESCHGPFQPGHPNTPMSVTPDAELCATCHKTTTDEWKASVHSQAGIQCEACHNPHSQTPKAETVTALCSNCHKERGDSFTHGTHASAGLECSNCHMYTSPLEEDPIQGLVPTGHTFSVGSDACVGCHQDTVHTRDSIVKLTGEVQNLENADLETLQKTVGEQEQTIASLETRSTVRLYTGLAQGAIVGLGIGVAVAWVVSKGLKVVPEEEDEQEKDQS
jgi:predicted CXXCH cytochrome family protein